MFKEMTCKEFKEILDSYFCDELLVETNHKFFSHLEQCTHCRVEMRAHREIRKRIKAVVLKSPQLQIDPQFERQLRSRLKETALSKPFWRRFSQPSGYLMPALAASVLVLLIGIGLFAFRGTALNVLIADSMFTNRTFLSTIADLTFKAVGDHKDCALEKLQIWESLSSTNYPDKAKFEQVVLRPIRNGMAGDIKLLHAHKCAFEGKEFTHVVLKYNAEIVSVFFDDSNSVPLLVESDSIVSESRAGMQVARFADRQGDLVLVVSDLSEAENLAIARALSDSDNSKRKS
ncbi:MAG: hypothetical protein AB1477_09020 [Acidobacteriota bacterium]